MSWSHFHSGSLATHEMGERTGEGEFACYWCTKSRMGYCWVFEMTPLLCRRERCFCAVECQNA